MPNCGIYKITCIINNKVYIGQSTDIEKRWKDHVIRLDNNSHDNSYLQNAWNKYGKEAFKFEIIEKCEKNFELLNAREIYWINYYEALKRSKGFNIASGGGNGYSLAGMTEEERHKVYEKIGKTRSKKYRGKNHPNYGKPMSEEQKAKLRQAFKGEKNPWYGKKRKEHSELMKGGNNPRAKKIICLTTNEVFDCAKDAGRKYNLTNSIILKCCKGVHKYAGRLSDGTKLTWKYADDYYK